MIETECHNIGQEFSIYEVSIEECEQIAEAYGILTVPTLVAGNKMLTGVPGQSDLHCFLLQAAAGRRSHHKKDQSRLLSHLVRRQKIGPSQEEKSEKVQTITQ
jgi:hypothetical protein